jgi:hypothetical protein
VNQNEAMIRRAVPLHIDETRHNALRDRLIESGLSDDMAERWLAAWEAEAARRGLDRGAVYSEQGERWIAEQRTADPEP